MATDLDTEPGQAAYTPLTLRLYDGFVLGLSNSLIWRCPTSHLQALYDRCVAGRHLDVGVGTGYFLDRATWPVRDPAITLLDLNPHCLAAAAKRIRRYAPRTIQADVLKPLPSAAQPAYGSIGICYLLHCLPGKMSEKVLVFEHLRPLLTEDGVVFGATILQGDRARSFVASKLMDLYNAKGVFSNVDDRLEDLDRGLRGRFADVRLTLKGAVALFEARGQRGLEPRVST